MIVIPYRDIMSRDVTSPITSGGIERFIRHLRDELTDSCVVDVTRLYYAEDQAALARYVAEEAEGADLVICNYPNPYLNVCLEVSAPVVWVNHHTSDVYPEANTLCRRMNFHVINGNKLWMVSRKQADDWAARSRLLGIDLKWNGVIPPSMVRNVHVHSGRIEWDLVTVGRCDPGKNPFLVHEVAIKAKMKSLVMTGFTADDYAYKNRGWAGDQTTEWDRTDAHVSHRLSQCGVFLVTWPDETFGIAALEALAHGLPLVIYSPRGDHACEELIPGSPWIVKARTFHEIADAVRHVGRITPLERTKLAIDARARHGVHAWRKKLEEMVA